MVRFDLTEVVLAADEAGLKRLLDAFDAKPADLRISGDVRQGLLHLLPVALIRKYEALRRPELLELAISFIRAHVGDDDLGADDGSSLHASLATALLLGYQRTGTAGTLEEAIAASRASLAVGTVSGDERAGRLATLARLFALRSAGFNSPGDLNRAVALLEESVAVDDTGAEKSAECWSDLAGALRDKFHRDRDTPALERAITALREAVRLAPRGSALEQVNRINLAGAVRDHALISDNIGELDESITEIETTVQGLPSGDPNLAGYLYSLGMGYLAKYRLEGGADDLRAAQSILRDALSRTGSDQQVHASIAMSLVDALARENGGSAQALRLLDVVSDHSTAAAVVRFDAASTAGRLRLAAGCYRKALPAWGKAVNLLPVVAWRGSRYRDRESTVGQYSGTATTAAACACAAGKTVEAIHMLETGRGILWGHLLEARAGLERVRAVRPDLATKLEAVKAVLDATHHD